MPKFHRSKPSKVINDSSLIFGLSTDDFLIFGISLILLESIGGTSELLTLGVLLSEVFLFILLRRNFRRKIIRDFLKFHLTRNKVYVSKNK